MKCQKGLSRRRFLQSTGSLTGAAYLRLMGPALAFRAADHIKAAARAGDI